MTLYTISYLKNLNRKLTYCSAKDLITSMQPIEIIYLFFAYMIAAIPFGVILSRVVVGKDVRSTGSGNIGATNVSRLMGKKWGIVVLTLDALKGYIVVDLAHHIGNQTYCNVIAAIAILAHCYPIYLKFRGGKGVATSLGAVAALSWITLGLLIAVFLFVFVISRRISPASLTAALALPVIAHFLSSDIIWLLGIFVAAIIWWKHRENLRRLIKNQEPRFF